MCNLDGLLLSDIFEDKIVFFSKNKIKSRLLNLCESNI